MNKLLVLGLLIFSSHIFSQIYDPVSWQTSVVKNSEGIYTLVAMATIESGWHLYSQDVPKDGPIPTTLSFTEDGGYELMGDVSEGGANYR